MKDHRITLRLTESEYKKLSADAASAKMTQSEYLRHLIAGNTPVVDNRRQELAKQFCRIYVVINEEKLENNNALMKVVDDLCQNLY